MSIALGTICGNEDVAMSEGGGSVMDPALALAELDPIGPSARSRAHIASSSDP